MARILLVSKPICPPWNDSSKNLVRDLAAHMKRHAPIVLSKRGVETGLPGLRVEPIYPATTRHFAPAFADNLRVMLRLVAGGGADLWHFFFAPNPRTSRAASWARGLRKARTVQTICSAPRPEVDLKSVLFADRTVVLSKFTEQRLLNAGIGPQNLRRIAPAVAALEPPDRDQQRAIRNRFGLPEDRLLIVYPGDLEFSAGAERAVFALADLPREVSAHLAMACRAKTGAALEHERRLKTLAAQMGLEALVTWIGETGQILKLLGAADLVILPADNLYAKMDLPLALLEAMAMGRPVVVAAGTPAEELAEGQAAWAVENSREAISAATAALLRDEGLRRAMAERAAAAARERFGLEMMAAAYEQLYDELTG